MRASSMFALTLALLAGLGAVVAARYAGVLGKPEQPAPPVVKEKEIQVLVAGRNLFPGDLIDAAYVKTRALRPEEKAEYDKEPNDYLPANPAAAALRVPLKPIEAEAPIRRRDLQVMVKPEPLHERLLANMRAVTVSVQKDQSAGGLIQVGEWVDVYLTTAIQGPNVDVTKTAPMVQNCRVIAKRNSLWNIFAGLPDNKPVSFTLEANPYRAALLEFAKSKGSLSLVPVSGQEQKVLEEQRKRLMQVGAANQETLPVSFAPQGRQGGDILAEQERVLAFNRAELSVGHNDLMRIFEVHLPPPPPSPRPGYAVERFNGLTRVGVERYGPDGDYEGAVDTRRLKAKTPTKQRTENESPSFKFCTPGTSSGGKPRKT